MKVFAQDYEVVIKITLRSLARQLHIPPAFNVSRKGRIVTYTIVSMLTLDFDFVVAWNVA